MLEIIENMDLIFIQEHWLYSCQSYIIRNTFPDYEVLSKCVDDRNPLKPYCMPRGMGGVAILWKADLHRYISVINDFECSRVAAITLQYEGYKLCIINAYMPSGNNTSKKNEFMETLEIIRSIISSHVSSYYVLLIGDMNIDVTKQA